MRASRLLFNADGRRVAAFLSNSTITCPKPRVWKCPKRFLRIAEPTLRTWPMFHSFGFEAVRIVVGNLRHYWGQRPDRADQCERWPLSTLLLSVLSKHG